MAVEKFPLGFPIPFGDHSGSFVTDASDAITIQDSLTADIKSKHRTFTDILTISDSIRVISSYVAPPIVEVTFSSTLTDVIFSTQPAHLIKSIDKNVETYTFASGNVGVLDKNKNADRLTLDFNITLNAYNIIHWLNAIMDAQMPVDVSGLSNIHLNTEYLISDVNAIQNEAYDDKYDVSIVLERRYDRLI